MKKPISLIIDDPAPGIHVYYHHIPDHKTQDGRPLLPFVDNALLDRFCDAAEAYDLKGKFSVIPMAGNQGCITTGFCGIPDEKRLAWIETAKARLASRFAFCPEILTHANAIDLDTQVMLPMNEQVWFAQQDRSTMTPYVAQAIRLLCQVGLPPPA